MVKISVVRTVLCPRGEKEYPMRRPFAVIGFTYLSVLLAASFFGYASNAAVALILVICSIVSFFALSSFKNGRTAAVIFLTAAAALGMWCLFTRFFYQPAVSLGETTSKAYNGTAAVVTGTIEDLPTESNGKYYYVIKSDTITENGKAYKTGVKIRAAFQNKLSSEPFDRLTFETSLYIPESGGSGYDSAAYYKSKGIYLFASSCKNVSVAKTESKPLYYQFIRLRVFMQNTIYSAMSGTPGGLAAGILIGDTSKLPDRVKQDFNTTGISHLLAVSGTQTSLIAQVLLMTLCFMKCPRRLSAAISMTAVAVFMAVTGFSASVTRAGIMSLIYLAALIVKREADALNSLGVSVFLLCLVNPFAATDTGLLLSFTATLGMITISGRLYHKIETGFSHLPEKLSKILLKPVGILCETIGASLITYPVIILTFGRVSLIALVSNMIEVPLSLLVTLTTALIVLLSPIYILHLVVVPLAAFTGWICSFLMWFAGILASLPFASISAKYGFVNIYLLFLMITVILYFILRNKGAHAGVLLVCSLFTLSTGILSYVVSTKGVLEMTELPVGNGSCAILIKDGQAAVIGLSGYKPEIKVQNYLKAHDISRINALILTSYSKKCVDSANNLIGVVPVGKVYCPGSFQSADNRFLNIVSQQTDIEVLKNVNLTLIPDGKSLMAAAGYHDSSALFLDSEPQGSLDSRFDLLFFNAQLPSSFLKNSKPGYTVAGQSTAALYCAAQLEHGGSKTLKAGTQPVGLLTRGNGKYIPAPAQ